MILCNDLLVEKSMKVFSMMRAYVLLFVTLFRILINVFYGIYKISRLTHAPITIFGGARLQDDSEYMKKATELARMLAESGIPVLTGGGPGIMQAASCGAVGFSTIGITVTGLDTKAPSACQPNIIIMRNYLARKWLLIHYSVGFAIFPGGYGTLDELTDLLTLIQTKIQIRTPIVLIGKDYWRPFMEWVTESALKNNLIAQEDVELFVITDDITEAFQVLKDHAHKESGFTPL